MSCFSLVSHYTPTIGPSPVPQKNAAICSKGMAQSSVTMAALVLSIFSAIASTLSCWVVTSAWSWLVGIWFHSAPELQIHPSLFDEMSNVEVASSSPDWASASCQPRQGRRHDPRAYILLLGWNTKLHVSLNQILHSKYYSKVRKKLILLLIIELIPCCGNVDSA